MRKRQYEPSQYEHKNSSSVYNTQVRQSNERVVLNDRDEDDGKYLDNSLYKKESTHKR